MSSTPPPTKKARRSATAMDPKQLTLTGLLFKHQAAKSTPSASSRNNSDDVVMIDDKSRDVDDLKSSRDCSSPELFSQESGDDSTAPQADCGDAGEGADKTGRPCDNKDLIGMERMEEGVAIDSPSLSSTRSNTSSPDTALPPSDGTPLSKIRFGPSTLPVLPPLRSSPLHSVLFVPRLKAGESPKPFPDKFKDVWDGNHVRMPCSSQNLFPVTSPSTGGKAADKTLVSRWDVIIQSLRKPIANSYDLEEAILSYNSRKWSFGSIHSYFSDHCSEEEADSFFSHVLPRVIDLALSLPNLVTHALPLLKKQLDYSISLSQQQIACLLANAFLCTFPRRNARGASSEYSNYPNINFNSLFYGNLKRGVSSVTANKLTCLFHYFTRVTKSMPVGVVTFHRQVLATPPQWEKSSTLLTQLHVDSEGTIEDNGQGMLQVDFANKYLGGGVLGEGCVQEEIRFLVCPELIISRLFTEELDDNESLVMSGAEQFSKYRGYASTFEWAGQHSDETTRDRWGRRETHIVAIDALVVRSMISQLRPGVLRREINKAYCGYMTSDLPPSPSGHRMAIATGNWGCGAFGGDPRLKSLLQLMAASQAGRDVVYFTFGDRELQRDLCTLHRQLVEHKVTVGQIWSVLVQYHTVFKSSHMTNPAHLYDYITRTLKLSCDLSSTDQAQDTVEYTAESD